jgi:pimeloyl-ACP methyl ester carboxylesterase
MPDALVLNHKFGGKAATETLLLIHPLGSDLHFWDECEMLWADRFTTLAVDLRFAGASPDAAMPMDMAGHAADIALTCARLGVDAAVVVGCALGGMVGAHLAASRPDFARALVMANPGIGNTPAARDMLRRRAERVRQDGMAHLLPEAPLRTFHNLPQDARFQRYAESFARLDPGRYAQSILGFLDADISADIPRIACPVLLVPAAHDILMDPDSAARITALLPAAESRPIGDAAHFAPYQAPESFAEMVVEFLEERLHTPR